MISRARRRRDTSWIRTALDGSLQYLFLHPHQPEIVPASRRPARGAGEASRGALAPPSHPRAVSSATGAPYMFWRFMYPT